MKKFLLLAVLFTSLVIIPASAQTENDEPVQQTEQTDTPKTEKSIDWFSVIVAGSYMIGVLVLLPLVVYTNMNEKIKQPTGEPLSSLDEEERNEKAAELLDHVESKLTRYLNDEGTEMVTIDKGSQARLMKRTLDYINVYLAPTDPEILEMVHENTLLYNQATERKYTGSNWVLGSAVGIVVLMGIIDLSMLFSTFILLHGLGIAFYFLSSRAPMYVINRRLSRFGGTKLGIVGTVLGGIFAGTATKYYVSHNGGAYERDWETEGNMAITTLFIVFVVALFVAFLVAFFGVLNFFLNYSTTFLSPLDNEEKWFKRTFGEEDERMITLSA
jgi:hypothetical protein